jgi:hypothetical protein
MHVLKIEGPLLDDSILRSSYGSAWRRPYTGDPQFVGTNNTIELSLNPDEQVATRGPTNEGLAYRGSAQQGSDFLLVIVLRIARVQTSTILPPKFLVKSAARR